MNGVKRDSSNSSAGVAVTVSMSRGDVDYEATEIHPMIMIGDNKTENSHDTEEKDSEDTENSGLPLDGGWAWMVLLGAVLEMTIVIGVLKTSGIFFVNFQERFDSTSSMTSLISTVQNGVFSVAALFVMTVGMKLASGRQLNMLGGTVLCISYIISSRAEDIHILLLSHGVLQGLGIACMQPIALTMVGTYFNKRRGFANSIAVSGGSLGGLIFAPLLTRLFEYYGYAGAMLIVSSFFLHGWVTGALFRPPSYYTKRQKFIHDKIHIPNKSADIAVTNKININGNIQRTDSFKRQDLKDAPASPLSLLSLKETWTADGRRRADTYSEGDTQNKEGVTLRRLQSQTDRSHTGSHVSLILNKIADSKIGKYASSEYVAGSLVDIPLKLSPEAGQKASTMSGNESKKQSSVLMSIFKLFDFSLFMNPVFVVFIISAGFLCASCALCPVFIAPHAKEIGVSSSGIATFLTVFSAIDLCSRIIVGIIADKGWLRRSTIIGISGCIVGTAGQFLRFYQSYEWIIFYAIIIGLFSGVHFSLFAVVIVDYLSLAKLKSVLGFTVLFHGAFVSLTFAVVGILRDISGSYLVPFHLMGSMSLIGGILMTSLSVIDRLYNKDEKPQEPETHD